MNLRKINVDGQIWHWNCSGAGNIIIKGPRGQKHHLLQTDVMGVTWDELERADHKGYAHMYAVTPGVIVELIREIKTNERKN